jgi:hypothetical protein
MVESYGCLQNQPKMPALYIYRFKTLMSYWIIIETDEVVS